MSVCIFLYVFIPALSCTIHNVTVSLGWKRRVASVPGRPPNSSGGGQRHQGRGSAGAAYTQEAAAGGAGSQCKAVHGPWGPAGSQVLLLYFIFYFFQFLPLHQSLGSPCSGCSSFLSEHNVDMRYRLESCHIPNQCFIHVIQTAICFHFSSRESLA